MFDNIEKYLAATGHFLGVQSERYGDGYRAVIGLHSDVSWLTDILTDAGDGGIQIQYFMGGNPLFPASWGKTAADALGGLDRKIGVLYDFVPPSEKLNKWQCHLNVELKAECDSDPGEAPETYKVDWFDVVADLREAYSKEGDAYFYEIAEKACSGRRYRNLHALINTVIPESIKTQLSSY